MFLSVPMFPDFECDDSNDNVDVVTGSRSIGNRDAASEIDSTVGIALVQFSAISI